MHVEHSGTDTDAFLAHHDDAHCLVERFRHQVVALTRRGVSESEAAESVAADIIDPAVRAEVRRKMCILRREGRTRAGRRALLARGFLQTGQVQERLLEWEEAEAIPEARLEREWERCRSQFESHMCKNINAYIFNGRRRTNSLAAGLARNGACEDFFSQPGGRALLADLAEAGVGHADGFADPAMIQSLHRWLRGLYEDGGTFRRSSDPCNTGSFFTGLEFDVGDGRGQLHWLEKTVHVGAYPAGGAAYARHLDKYDFEGIYNRSVTCLLYTNPHVAGGELRVYPPTPGARVDAGISGTNGLEFQPVAGRLVCFWSRTVFHEVLPTPAPGPPRFALTIWVQSGNSWRPRGFRRSQAAHAADAGG